MSPRGSGEGDPRIRRILDMLMEMASGNLKVCERISDRHDELDAVITGINMLAEELDAREVAGKKVETALQESEEKYRTLVENQGEGIAIVDTDELFIFANPAAAETFGVSPGELIGKNLLDFLGPEQKEIVLWQTEERKTGKRSVYDLEIIRPDGEERIIRATVTPRSDPDGKYLGAFGIFIDVTERKRVEEALRESEERYRAVVTQSDDCIFLVDIGSRRIIEANPAFERLLGYTTGEVSDLVLYDFVAHEQEDIDDRIEGITRSGTSFLGERRYRTKTGDVIDVEVNAGIISYGSRDVICVVSRGISERKRVEEALLASEEKYRNLVERANDGILIIQDFKVKYLNPRLAEMVGGAIDDLVGRKFTDFVHPDQVEILKSNYTRRMQGEDFENIYEMRFLRLDGTEVPGELNAGIITYGGRPANFVFIRDITERKRMQEELRHYAEHLENEVARRTRELIQAEKLAYIGQLVAGIAHEINSPLAVISLYAGMLLSDTDDERERGYLNIIVSHVNSASKIVSGLLDFTKISRMELTAIDLNELVTQITNVVGHQLKLSGISVENRLGSDIPPINGDRDRIKQVMMNIVMNAYHAIGTGGNITITTRSLSEGSVEIEVADDGSGISREDTERIFEPFFTTRSGKGTGLGLSISREIVESHGGSISLSSEPGKGTAFFVRLPAAGEVKDVKM